MANYYCLMAGAPDLDIAESKMPISIADFREQIDEALSDGDRRLISCFFLRRDCQNIVRLLKNPETELDPLGNYSREQYEDLILSAREMNYNVSRYPAFMSDFVRDYPERSAEPGFFAEDEMLYAFFRYAVGTCRNKMIREWWQLQLDINNILTAILSKKHGWDLGLYVKGDGEIQEMIRENKSPDFGLSLSFEYAKELMQIAEQEDPVEKEKMVDAFKWIWLDDQIEQDPFTIEAVFAYLCKLEMLDRWQNLDSEKGKDAFSRIIENLRGEAKVPVEFT